MSLRRRREVEEEEEVPKPSFRSVLKKLDVYPKVEEEFVEDKTSSGGIGEYFCFFLTALVCPHSSLDVLSNGCGSGSRAPSDSE